MTAIVVQGLGKAYKQYSSQWARLAEWLLPAKTLPRHRLHWVLKDINFTVHPGETVGLVGSNGAGKSTLLKMLAGTTLPTAGRIAIHGRVAALLELGMGFHPDFSGRQNALMSAQMMGIDARQAEAAMPDIEAFAEIGAYIDKPVRTYSSGMQMRLAFSVATAWRPEVLIVDEALSVGDAYFQHKSFERIRQFRAQGTTILLVSHDKGVIQSICDRAILLHQGQVALEGDPDSVMDYYNALLAERQGQQITFEMTAAGKLQTVSGSGEAVLEQLSLLDDKGKPLDVVEVGQQVTLEIVTRIQQPVPALVVGYLIKDRLGQSIFGTNTYHYDQTCEDLRPGQQVTTRFTFEMRTGPGSYSVSVALVEGQDHLGRNYEWRDLALMFSVINRSQPRFEGSSWMPPAVTAETTPT